VSGRSSDEWRDRCSTIGCWPIVRRELFGAVLGFVIHEMLSETGVYVAMREDAAPQSDFRQHLLLIALENYSSPVIDHLDEHFRNYRTNLVRRRACGGPRDLEG
jgi:hypothetical protein